MYGNTEYASIPYGDVVTMIVFIVDKRDIEIIFTSNAKTYEFISERKNNIFKAEETTGRRLGMI